MASVQVAGGWLRGMLLVSGRSAVRIRSPARGFRTIIPTSCLLRARSARLRGLLGLCQFGPGSLSHRIGQGALPLVRRMQIKSGAYGAAGALRRRAPRLGAPARHGRAASISCRRSITLTRQGSSDAAWAVFLDPAATRKDSAPVGKIGHD